MNLLEGNLLLLCSHWITAGTRQRPIDLLLLVVVVVFVYPEQGHRRAATAATSQGGAAVVAVEITGC